jgi:hypothetical protein
MYPCRSSVPGSYYSGGTLLLFSESAQFLLCLVLAVEQIPEFCQASAYSAGGPAPAGDMVPGGPGVARSDACADARNGRSGRSAGVARLRVTDVLARVTTVLARVTDHLALVTTS